MKLQFNINPVPASRPRVTRWSTFYPKKYTQFREDMGVLLSEHTQCPFKELIECHIELLIEMPKSWPKKKKESLEGKYCNNNSDLDNYAKAILDAMNTIVYDDDKQIVKLSISKRWGKDGKIVVELNEITK
jgi:Holliday junction resolvase RusA-like endonuclease